MVGEEHVELTRDVRRQWDVDGGVRYTRLCCEDRNGDERERAHDTEAFACGGEGVPQEGVI